MVGFFYKSKFNGDVSNWDISSLFNVTNDISSNIPKRALIGADNPIKFTFVNSPPIDFNDYYYNDRL